MFRLTRSLGQLITTVVVLQLLSFSATAAIVHAQPDGTINSIEGLFISTNQYVDVEFGALLAPGETTCMLGPGCPAGIYVIALNAFLNSGTYASVNSAAGTGADIFSVLTPATRLQYKFMGSSWVYSESGVLPATNDIRFTLSAVPVPAAVWLFASALIGLAGIKYKK